MHQNLRKVLHPHHVEQYRHSSRLFDYLSQLRYVVTWRRAWFHRSL